MREALFWMLSALLVMAALGVVVSRNLYRAAYCLAATLVVTAFLYLMLSSPLLAAVQIILYTGGVLTLVVFALVVTREPAALQSWRRPVPAIVVSGVVFGALAAYARGAGSTRSVGGLEDGVAVGSLLFRTYMVPFELLSVLLLAAIFGALMVARKERAG